MYPRRIFTNMIRMCYDSYDVRKVKVVEASDLNHSGMLFCAGLPVNLHTHTHTHLPPFNKTRTPTVDSDGRRIIAPVVYCYTHYM